MVRLQSPGLHLICLRAGLAAGLALAAGSARGDYSPEARALSYLAREVPAWSPENRCYSCHNNGDAARALYAAIRLGRPVAPKATADTDLWLAKPEGWDRNGGDGPFSDKKLARIQFASSLAAAVESGRVHDRGALVRAADPLAADQDEDGSWSLEDGGRVGSPATYGRPLATVMARATLRSADPGRFRARIDRAEGWLRRLEPGNIPDASARRLALDEDAEPGSDARREHDLNLIRRGQGPDGGWGPFVASAAEPFDTALALLALDQLRNHPGVPEMIARGRAYLIATQEEDGRWVETTRPAGGESYAQRLSTSGWATLALITVRDPGLTGSRSAAGPPPTRDGP